MSTDHPENNAPFQLPGHLVDEARDKRFLEFFQHQVERYGVPEPFLRSFAYSFVPQHYRFEATPDIAEIPFLRSLTFWILQDEFSLSEDEASNLILAFEEAIANVIRHSYPTQEANKWVATRLQIVDDVLQMDIMDRGELGRDPELPKMLESITKEGRPPLRRRGGLGLYLIRRIMDGMRYEIGDEINTLSLSKKIHPNK